jgi:16S rRNA (cytosine1402-N4)-methyltransferase
MVREVLEQLGPALSPGATVIDGTVGAGGHASEILPRITPGGLYIGMDRDLTILRHARQRLAPWGEAVRLVHAAFGTLGEVARAKVPGGAQAVLLDVGVSSLQLDDPTRGFGFRDTGPLDMRMDTSRGTTAADLVHRLGEKALADLIYRYGEERRSRAIAKAIVQARAQRRLTSTAELADIISGAVGPGYERGRIHPATRTFQALRIAVNEELEQLEAALGAIPGALAPGGRVAVIAFHSLEDRLVKVAFRDARRAGRLEVLTKKPLRPAADEVRRNRRARSARLRAAMRPVDGSP